MLQRGGKGKKKETACRSGKKVKGMGERQDIKERMQEEMKRE